MNDNFQNVKVILYYLINVIKTFKITIDCSCTNREFTSRTNNLSNKTVEW
jgi:hypothetical protein